jgi:hypothetical protein
MSDFKEINPLILEIAYESMGFNSDHKIVNPYGFFERIFNPPKDEFGRSLKFKKDNLKNKPVYRMISEDDWNYVLKIGRFRKSFPLNQDEKTLENLKRTNPLEYKRIIYSQNSRNFTRVTPNREYSSNFNNSKNPLLIEFKPISKKLFPSTELGGNDELFAKNLSLKDVLVVRDKSGKIIYDSRESNLSSEIEDQIKEVYLNYRSSANSRQGSKKEVKEFREYLKCHPIKYSCFNPNSLEKKLFSAIFLAFFISGLFFSLPTLTGNVIGSFGTGNKLLGIVLIFFGIGGFFIYNLFKKDKL